jgi:hypothetical protein
LTERVISQIRFETEQIDQLFQSYANLLAQSQKETPDLVQVTAIASVLHTSYNGLENIFLSIAKGIDGSVPVGTQWHRDLLTRMTESTEKRKAVRSIEIGYLLVGYLGFRHYYRHSYSFFLEWSEVERLVTPLAETWSQVRGGLESFMSSLS